MGSTTTLGDQVGGLRGLRRNGATSSPGYSRRVNVRHDCCSHDYVEASALFSAISGIRKKEGTVGIILGDSSPQNDDQTNFLTPWHGVYARENHKASGYMRFLCKTCRHRWQLCQRVRCQLQTADICLGKPRASSRSATFSQANTLFKGSPGRSWLVLGLRAKEKPAHRADSPKPEHSSFLTQHASFGPVLIRVFGESFFPRCRATRLEQVTASR